MEPTSKNNVPHISKWHLAIILGVGTPIALGAAYWYFRKRNSDKIETCEDIYANDQTSQTPATSVKKDSYHPPSTPFEKAKAAKEKGNKFFREGQFDKAIECYTSAIETCPSGHSDELATFYQNRASSYKKLKNYEAVIRDCSKSLEYNKTYVKAFHRRAEVYEETGDLRKCLEDATTVCMLDGFRTDLYLQMTDRVLKTLSKTEAKEEFKKRKPTLPSKHFIRHYFISFSEDPIMKMVEDYRREKKDWFDLTGFKLVVHHLAEENYDEVIPHCDVEINRNGPDMAEALLVRGTFKLLQGQIQDSLNDMQRLLSLESVDVKVKVNCLIKVGTLKVQLEKMDEALEDFNRATELDLNNSDIYLHRGQVHLLMEHIGDCLKDLEKSCSLNPNFPSAKAQKCYIQYRCGLQFNDENQKTAALKGFEETEKNFPNCNESVFLYAQVLSECGEFEKADKYFCKAGELDPKDPNVYVHRAILNLQWKEDIEGSIDLLYKAISMDEKCQFGYETLGSIEVQRGNLKKGLELFEKAVTAAHTETELAHLYSLLLAAQAQKRAAEISGFSFDR